MRLYNRGAAFCKKMRAIISTRLLAANYELRRKVYKAFCKDPNLPSDMRDKHRYKLSKLPRNTPQGPLMGIKKSSW
ncbi:hypothetical protein AMTRI_Chr12g236490 [Amborella trichopoda]